MIHNENMKKKFQEGGEKVRLYARQHNLNFTVLSKILNNILAKTNNTPIAGASWDIYKQLKKDDYYTGPLPWAESVDPFSHPYKGVGMGAFDDNGHLVLSKKITTSTVVPGELKIFIATLDALASDPGHCSLTDVELGKIMALKSCLIVDTLVHLLGLKLIDIQNVDEVRQIRVVGA